MARGRRLNAGWTDDRTTERASGGSAHLPLPLWRIGHTFPHTSGLKGQTDILFLARCQVNNCATKLGVWRIYPSCNSPIQHSSWVLDSSSVNSHVFVACRTQPTGHSNHASKSRLGFAVDWRRRVKLGLGGVIVIMHACDPPTLEYRMGLFAGSLTQYSDSSSSTSMEGAKKLLACCLPFDMCSAGDPPPMCGWVNL